jgi:transposase-like protein
MASYNEIPLEELADEVSFLAPKSYKSCPACSESKKRFIGSSEGFSLYQCPTCQHQWRADEACAWCGGPPDRIINAQGICDQCK